MKDKVLKIELSVLVFLFFLTAGTGIVYAEPYGWSPNVDNSWQGAPKCTDPKPDKAPVLLEPNHPVLPKKPKAGEVVLYWHRTPGAENYNVYYGLTPKNYIFSAPDIGNTDNFTVRFLANKVYYFAVQAKKGCAASSLSQEWKVRPGVGRFVAGNVQGVGVKAVQRTTVPTYKQTPSAGNVGTTTTVISTPVPAVQGAQTGRTGAGAVEQPTPVTPKPKSLWEKILSIFFGK